MINNYTISDFYNTFASSLKILAGSGGMTRNISNVGILDYEIDPVQKDKFFHTNFQKDQLIITTFSVARENPHLILDAIKYLHAKGTSGLVIKNVFNLPIHETIIRYANSKNYPIIVTESQNIYVESMILEVYKKIFFQDTLKESRKYADIILEGNLTPEEVEQYARKINPSAATQYYSIFVKQNTLSGDTVEEYYSKYVKSSLNTPRNTFIPYDEGFFIILADNEVTPIECASLITKELENITCGISNRHSSLKEFDVSLKESIYATHIIPEKESVSFFKDIGAMQVLLPFAHQKEMQRFKERILEPISDYDIENNSNLILTLRTYLKFDCDLIKTAEHLSQHKNSIRYRLDKIHALTGLDYKSFSDLEQLSLALKIESVEYAVRTTCF